MREYRVTLTSKSAKLIKDIVKTEELDVQVKYIDDAVGDTVISIYGSNEEVNTLKSIYEMVA